jgi:hypothetical protein
MNNNTIVVDNITYRTGDNIICCLDAWSTITDAKIFIPDNNANLIFICQNKYNGKRCIDTLGYNYSYVIDKCNFNYFHIKKINKNCFTNIIEQAFPVR